MFTARQQHSTKDRAGQTIPDNRERRRIAKVAMLAAENERDEIIENIKKRRVEIRLKEGYKTRCVGYGSRASLERTKNI